MHKTTGRILRSPHRTPLPSSHFAADGKSARPSASFAPPPALGCSCHHFAPVNSLRALVVFIGCLLSRNVFPVPALRMMPGRMTPALQYRSHGAVILETPHAG